MQTKNNKYFINFVYIEPIMKYWKKNEFMSRDNKCKYPTGTTIIGDVERGCFVFYFA